MNSCLYTGAIRHRRHRPVIHEFRYRMFMFYLDLDELDELHQRVHLFSVNRANLVSFHDRDHLDRRPGSTKTKTIEFLRRQGLDLPDGKVFLLTSCRLLGYVFNPISLYYCHTAAGRLEAVVAEVRNTFGEQYLYLLRDTAGDTGSGEPRPAPRRFHASKALHVSPFISMDAAYDFRLLPVGDTLSVGIVEHEAGRHVLDAQLRGTRMPLTTASLARVALTYPLMTLKTIAAIHGEALRLYLKRAPYHRQPDPSAAQKVQRDLMADLDEPVQRR